MDLSNLKEQVSNLTLYDLKAGVRKVQNGKSRIMYRLALYANPPIAARYTKSVRMLMILAVMNYTEMESKVRVTLPEVSSLRQRSVIHIYMHTHEEAFGCSRLCSLGSRSYK
jgi:hypothetical protein